MTLRQRTEKTIDRAIQLVLSPRSRAFGERAILAVAISSYVVHLILITLVHWGLIVSESRFLTSPISAIYTPFSFILVYEVYLLIFHLPQSTSSYIGKQYEIITLIVIRRIFKDIGTLELSLPWFENDNDLQFTYDAVTSLLLFFLLYLFYHKIRRRHPIKTDESLRFERRTSEFVLLKKSLSVLLVPTLLMLAVYSLWHWVMLAIKDQSYGIDALTKINNIFFEEFFTILIMVDVFILLASFYYSDRFHTIIRNSGFVISTVLIKVSFSVSGVLNNLLILGSVLFGLAILYIHDLFERQTTRD